MEEFKGLRGKEEEAAPEEAGDGFQVVHGKKKKRPSGQDGGSGGSDAILGSGSARMTTKGKAAAAPRAKAKVTFHDPSIPRPQDVYSIRVNNYNLPFDHVWLERSEDGTRPVHPLEKLPVEQFINRNVPESEPVKPADLEDTSFTLVEDKKGLAELDKKLKSVNEFAVDLEHNQYRSFQGLTCLMQISTRTEDFIVDTLKLRIYIGLYLKEHFKDQTKRKVMHGADRDIMWLQRDFHIYVCNLFDTGQASRILQMERNTLEHLLHHFCGVTANKEYQNADWRSRPLPDEMIKYAREDTHYLLYMYDLMRLRLQRESTCENDLLLEVQKRSNEICLQLYEKELLTDTSYLHIYGLQGHELNADQLAVVFALHQWRDYIARQEDESTGYVLPNKALIEIAKKMPTSTAELQRIVKSKYPFVENNLDLIVDIVWDATENSHAFEGIVEQLKKEQLEQLEMKSMLATGEVIEMGPSVADNDRSNFDPAPSSTANTSVTSDSRGSFMNEAALIGSIWLENRTRTILSSENKTSWTSSGLIRPIYTEVLSNSCHKQASVQELKRAMPFGALVSTSGRLTDNFGGFSNEKAESKVEKVKSSPAIHDPEGMQTSSSMPGSDHGFQSTNQRSTGTGQPAAVNKEADVQAPRRQQSFRPSGN